MTPPLSQQSQQFKQSQRVYGVILVSPQERYLMVRGRATGKWSFPKGHIEAGESPLQCAKRELYEETGVSLGKLEPTRETPFRLKAAQYFIFRPAVEAKVCTIDAREVTDVRWLSAREIARLPSNVDVSFFLEKLDVQASPGRNNCMRCHMPTGLLLKTVY